MKGRVRSQKLCGGRIGWLDDGLGRSCEKWSWSEASTWTYSTGDQSREGGGAAGVVHTEVAASLLQPENSNYYVLNIGEAAEMNDA